MLSSNVGTSCECSVYSTLSKLCPCLISDFVPTAELIAQPPKNIARTSTTLAVIISAFIVRFFFSSGERTFFSFFLFSRVPNSVVSTLKETSFVSSNFFFLISSPQLFCSSAFSPFVSMINLISAPVFSRTFREMSENTFSSPFFTITTPIFAP